MSESKTRRGLWWKRSLLSVAGLVLLLLAVRLIWARVEASALDRAVTGFEERWGPLDLSALGPQEVFPSENRARYFRAAADLLDYRDQDDAIVRGRGDRMTVVRRVAADPEGVRAVVDRNRIPLALAAEAALRPGSDWEIRYEEGIDASLPRLLNLLNLGRLMAADAALDVQTGEPDKAIEAMNRGLALSASLRQEQALIVSLVGSSIEAQMVGVLRGLLARGDLTTPQLDRLDQSLRDLPGPETIAAGLKGEAACIHALLLDVEGGGGSGAMGSRSRLHSSAAAWLLRPVYLKAHTYYLEEVSRYLERIGLPPHLRDEVDPALTIPWYARILSVIPNDTGLYMRADLTSTRAGLAATAVALRRYRMERGAWPVALDDLAPGYLHAVPTDPFTGKAFEYSTDGRGVLLRSAGEEEALKSFWGFDSLMIWDLPS